MKLFLHPALVLPQNIGRARIRLGRQGSLDACVIIAVWGAVEDTKTRGTNVESVPEAERETSNLRLLATAAIAAGIYSQQAEAVERVLSGLLIVLAYVLWCISLRRFAISRIRSSLLVYGMVIVDAAFLIFALDATGGIQSTFIILFPVFILIYAIYSGYRASFFAASVISVFLVMYSNFVIKQGMNAQATLSYQVPLFFVLAYFGGFLVKRTSLEREKRNEFVEHQQKELQRSKRTALDLKESTKRDIATYLHGHVQGRLLALRIQLEQLIPGIDKSEQGKVLEEVVEQMDRVIEDDLRTLSHQLYPSVLRLGLIAGLRSLADHFALSTWRKVAGTLFRNLQN